MLSNFLKMFHYYYIILVVQVNYCDFGNSIDQRSFTNATAMNFFRFRDFEPRHAFKTDLFRPSQNKRKPRGFQFHTDNRDFNVDLEFIVPFIRIPIERSMAATQTAFRNLLNLDVQAILTTGAIVAIGGVFAVVLKIIFTQYALISNYRKSFRSNDFENHMLYNQTYNNESVSEFILTFHNLATLIETKLQENNIDLSQCIQRSLCNYAQESFCYANKACRDGLPRILSGVSSLDFVQNYLSGTSMKTALDSAKNGDNCIEIFSNCNLALSPIRMLKMLVQNVHFLNLT